MESITIIEVKLMPMNAIFNKSLIDLLVMIIFMKYFMSVNQYFMTIFNSLF
jgi:hypothetical protein